MANPRKGECQNSSQRATKKKLKQKIRRKNPFSNQSRKELDRHITWTQRGEIKSIKTIVEKKRIKIKVANEMEDSKPIRTAGAVEGPLNCVSRPATYNIKGKQENQLRAIKGGCY